jgi:phosphoglucosamine mutase
LRTLGLTLHRSQVGDRYVIEMMKQKGCNIGGEQSGHIILNDYATTGDGLIAAMQILSLLAERRMPMHQLAKTFDPFPQKLVNVHAEASRLNHKDVQEAIIRAQEILEGKGRLFIRPSGTEPLIRIMVESQESNIIDGIISPITDALHNAA